VPQVIVTDNAVQGLERCRRFLAEKNPQAMRRAAQVIQKHFLLLETTPDVGRPIADLPDLRELVMTFGGSGYVALYRYVPAEQAVYVLAFRHQREAGY
jgi:plasmid stabilization system protein ParE